MAFEISFGGDREGQEPSRGEAIDESGEEIPLEVVHHQDQVPWSRRQRFGREIGDDRVDLGPSPLRRLAHESDGDR